MYGTSVGCPDTRVAHGVCVECRGHRLRTRCIVMISSADVTTFLHELSGRRLWPIRESDTQLAVLSLVMWSGSIWCCPFSRVNGSCRHVRQWHGMTWLLWPAKRRPTVFYCRSLAPDSHRNIDVTTDSSHWRTYEALRLRGQNTACYVFLFHHNHKNRSLVPYLHRVSEKKTSTHIIGYKLTNSCLILVIFDNKIPHIIWHRKTA